MVLSTVNKPQHERAHVSAPTQVRPAPQHFRTFSGTVRAGGDSQPVRGPNDVRLCDLLRTASFVAGDSVSKPTRTMRFGPPSRRFANVRCRCSCSTTPGIFRMFSHCPVRQRRQEVNEPDLMHRSQAASPVRALANGRLAKGRTRFTPRLRL